MRLLKNSPFSFSSVSLLRSIKEHAAEDVYEVVQSPQVAFLPVAFNPGSPVVQGHRGRQGNSLPKVDHPNFGLSGGVVHEQKRAPHNLRRRSRENSVRRSQQICSIVREQLEKSERLTSCVLKNCDCSRTQRSSSNRCR